jgi:hypothetical protein
MSHRVDPRDAKSVLDFLRSDDDGDIAVPVGAPQPPVTLVADPVPATANANQSAAELLALENSERLARTECALNEADARVDVGLHLPRPTQDRAAAIYEHNRKMITTDLVQELYEANKQQREQMDQLIGVLMMMKQQQQQAGVDRGTGRQRYM